MMLGLTVERDLVLVSATMVRQTHSVSSFGRKTEKKKKNSSLSLSPGVPNRIKMICLGKCKVRGQGLAGLPQL